MRTVIRYCHFTTLMLFSFVLTALSLSVQATTFSPDKTFGTAGVVLEDISPGASNNVFGSTLDSSGRLLVVGNINQVLSTDILNNSFVARFLPDGTLDHTFGIDGVTKLAIADGGSSAQGIVFYKNKILITGYCYMSNNQTQLYAAKLSVDGQPDVTFGNNGVKLTGVYTSIFECGYTSVQILENDKISIAWYSRYSSSVNGTHYIVRLNSDSSFDISFNKTGIYTYYPCSGSVLIKPLNYTNSDGNFVLSGLKNGAFLNFLKTDATSDVPGLIIYNQIYNPQAIRRDSNGNYYVAFTGSDNNSMNILKVNANGIPDSNFGNKGVASVTFSGSVTQIAAMTLCDDKIVLGSFISYNSTSQVALAVFNSTGVVDTEFGTGGIEIRPVQYKSVIKEIVYNSSTKEVFVCGTSNKASALNNIMILKYALPKTTTNLDDALTDSKLNICFTSQFISVNNLSYENGVSSFTIYNTEGDMVVSNQLLTTHDNSFYFVSPIKSGFYIVNILNREKNSFYKFVID